jgi:Tol biopolymer transport system component
MFRVPSPRRSLALAALVSLTAGAVVVGANATPASAAACTVDQITAHLTGASSAIAMNADGSRIAFSGNGRFIDEGTPTPGNTTQLWLYDVPSDTITRLTSNTDGFVTSSLAINDAGDQIAFTSTANIAGNNPDGNFEIYRWSEPSTITPITTTAVTVSHSSPSMDASGDLIAYQSNLDGNTEIYLHDADAVGDDDQITTTEPPTFNGGASLDDTGDRLAFFSDADGNNEMYLHVRTGGGSTTKITSAGAGTNAPGWINDAGNRVTYNSDRNVGGGNADGNLEIFQKNLSTGATRRLTSTTGPSSAYVTHSNAAGTRIAFNDSRNPVGQNADGSQEAFVRDVGGTDHTTQLSSTVVDLATVSAVDETGTRVAYFSTADPFGENADGNAELFLATCGSPVRSFDDVAYGNAFFDQIEWMTETEVASGFAGGVFKPKDPVKRGQMANFLYNLAGQPSYSPPGTPTFVDVPTTNPFYLQIEWMNAAEVASGFAGGVFKPTDPVKRQQMANFLYNLAGQPAFVPPGSPTFSDYPPSSAFYLQVEWMSARDIASGFPGGRFKPNDAVQRQQMANFVFNFATCCPVLP